MSGTAPAIPRAAPIPLHQNAAGCDSIATLILTVNNVATSTTNVTLCSNQLPYVWNGTSYNAAGSYIFMTANAAGCGFHRYPGAHCHECSDLYHQRNPLFKPIALYLEWRQLQ